MINSAIATPPSAIKRKGEVRLDLDLLEAKLRHHAMEMGIETDGDLIFNLRWQDATSAGVCRECKKIAEVFNIEYKI